MRVFELAEGELGVGLGPVGGDHVGDGPVVVAGDQDAFAEDLGFQLAAGAVVDVPGQTVLGGCVAGEVPVDDPAQPGVGEQSGDLGGDLVGPAAGFAAGEGVGQIGEFGLGFGDGLVEPAGLRGVQRG